jgi:hypothetical protein
MDVIDTNAPKVGAPVTSEMLDAGMAIVWATDITHPRENELREMLREAFVVMSRITGPKSPS